MNLTANIYARCIMLALSRNKLSIQDHENMTFKECVDRFYGGD